MVENDIDMMKRSIALFLTWVGVALSSWSQERLVWSDNFDGIALDTTKWSYNIWPAFKSNRELQAYTSSPSNVLVKDGCLQIVARREAHGNAAYTSGRIVTKGKGDWLYGKIEVRAKLPQGRGVWPAIWMLPTDNRYGGWPHSGEIDIMEFVGFEPDTVHATIHTGAYNHVKKTDKGSLIKLPDSEDGFHVYGCEWNKDSLKFYVDGLLYHTFENDGKKDSSTWPFDQPFHIVLNLAIGGNWGGMRGVDDSIFPQVFYIDWVKVYQ